MKANSTSGFDDNDDISIIAESGYEGDEESEESFLPSKIPHSHETTRSDHGVVSGEQTEEIKGVRDVSVPPSLRFLPPGVLPVPLDGSGDDESEISSDCSDDSLLQNSIDDHPQSSINPIPHVKLVSTVPDKPQNQHQKMSLKFLLNPISEALYWQVETCLSGLSVT